MSLKQKIQAAIRRKLSPCCGKSMWTSRLGNGICKGCHKIAVRGAVAKPIEPVCVWKYDDDGDFYDTSCGDAICINEGTPKDNNYNYCPICGKRIKEVRPKIVY